MGAWAFHIPKLGIARTGIEEGLFNTDIEMIGAIRGIQYAHEHCELDAIVYSLVDEHGVHAWIHELRRRLDGKTSRNGGHIRPANGGGARTNVANKPAVLAALHQLTEIMRTRTVVANLTQSQHNKSHEFCHTLCRRALKDHLRQLPELYAKLKKTVPPVAIERAIAERQKCLNRAALLTAWIKENTE